MKLSIISVLVMILMAPAAHQQESSTVNWPRYPNPGWNMHSREFVEHFNNAAARHRISMRVIQETCWVSERKSDCDLRFGRFVVGGLVASPDGATLRDVNILDAEGAHPDNARTQTFEFSMVAGLLAVLFEPDSEPHEHMTLWRRLVEGHSNGVRYATLRGTRFSFHPVRGLGNMIIVEPFSGDANPTEAPEVLENAWE